MTALRLFARPFAARLLAWRAPLVAAGLGAMLAACGGGSANAPSPPESGPVVVAVPPTITQQPANVTVTAGQSASFTVAATGDAPLAYQWQRNGVAIAGATSTTYTLAATVLGDSGATFRAVVTNGAGSATSNNATLTVTAAAPVLTITPQPANVSVTAGSSASFTVGGTCSSGTLAIQWQRNNGSAGAFADIAGATAVTYTFTTAIGDNAAQFRAALSCSGQSAANSSTATLTVTAPSSVTLSLYPTLGRDQARVNGAAAIDRLPDGSYAVSVGSQLKRLSADLSTLTPITGVVQSGYRDGPAATAQFGLPQSITHDSAGVLYVADLQNNVIRRVAIDGTVSTLAGTAGVTGAADGTGAAASFRDPFGIAIGPDGDLYVADRQNSVIRRVTTAGVVTTYAGSGAAGLLDGPAATAQFQSPQGVAVAANGDVIVSDSGNSRVRRIVRAGNAAGLVETLAGTTVAPVPGADGPGATAVIFNPNGIVVQGNFVFVRDGAGLIRRIDLTTRVVTTFAGSRTRLSGFADGPLGQAQFASFNNPGITTTPSGDLLVAETKGLRRVDSSGTVTTIATANAFETDAGVGVLAQLPLTAAAIAVDSQGLIANYDDTSQAVRRIDSMGNLSLVAGLTGSGNAYDGQGSAAQFIRRDTSPLAAGAAGVLYAGNGASVRRIAADGTAVTIAGDAVNFGVVDGPGATARFNNPTGLAVAANGDVIVADPGSYALRKINAAGVVSTIAGSLGTSGAADGPAGTARLQGPRYLTITPDGSIWFIDGPQPGVGRLRKLSADGTTVSSGFAGVSNINLVAIASDANGILYVMQNADLALAGALVAYNPATNTAAQVLPANVGQTLVLGANGSLPPIRSIAVLGPKRILLSAGTGQLLLATLP